MNTEVDGDDVRIRHIKKQALNVLENGPRPMQAVRNRCQQVYGVRLPDAKVWDALGQLRAANKVVRLDDPNEWYQLADWDERPLRLMTVSHHLITLKGLDQFAEMWFDESVRAARYEHGIADQHLQPMPSDDERRLYHISMLQLPILNQYRETLRRLASEVEDSNEEKATVYRRLAEATKLENEADYRDEVVVLRE